MITRLKYGISKKKAFLSTKHPPDIPTNGYYDGIEPTSYTEAVKHPKAMFEEFLALQR